MKSLKKFDVKMLALWLLALTVFLMLAFLPPMKRNIVFGIAVGATLVMFGFVAVAYALSFMYDETLTSKLLGYPIFRVSVFALGAQGVICLLLVVLSRACPIWLAVAVEGVMIAGAAVAMIGTEAARGVVESNEDALSDRIANMKRLRRLALVQRDAQMDECVRAAAARLAEALAYADPVTSEATREAEERIEVLLGTLTSGSSQERLDAISQAEACVRQRSAAAKESK